MVFFYSENVNMPSINRRAIVEWVGLVVKAYDKESGDINYIFCDDDEILNVNRKFLGHDYYTDIITFDYTLSHKLSGDIYISLDTVRSNSEQFGTPFNEELNRVMIHGILHLCGIEDKKPGQRAKMRKAEDKALLLLPQILNKK